jgi:osmotically-inducible protein OsmY
MTTRRSQGGPLAATALRVVALAASAAAPGQTSMPAGAESPQVVITASRESDAALVARVEQAMHSDPYVFVDHVSVSAQRGVVRVEGIVQDPADMLQLLRLARRIAGKRRVINEIEVVSGAADHD